MSIANFCVIETFDIENTENITASLLEKVVDFFNEKN